MPYDISDHKRKRYINPITVIMLNVFLPVVNTFFPSDKGILFTLIFVELLLLFMEQYKKFVKTTIFLFVFFALYILSLHIPVLTFMASVFKMTIVFLPSCVLAVLLINGYQLSEVFSGLQKLRLPKIFVIGLTVTIRYIPTFIEEFKLIRASMQIRGVKCSVLHPIRTFEYLLVPQLFRCLSLSAELTSAALTKGIEAPVRRVSYFDRPLSRYDYATVLILLVGHGLVIAKIV